MSNDPRQRPLWTKTPFALVLWIGWALVAQFFICGAFFWGYARGTPLRGEHRFVMSGFDSPVVRPWVWWTSYVSFRVAVAGLVLVILGLAAGWLTKRYMYRWYLDSKNYVVLRRAIAIAMIVCFVLCVIGFGLNIIAFGWQFAFPGPQ